ncbi:MAG: hydantoinase B/oxoprolinase family protein, partial [Nitrospinota bacterium]
MARKSFDPLTLDVLWSRLAAIADEAAASVVRASFSTTVREGNDFGCVLLDPGGNLVAQSSLAPAGFTGTLPLTAKRLLKEFPARGLRPGDMLLTNDPWIGAGHLADVSSLNPLFYKGRLVAFCGVASHVVDMGGRLPSPEARELFEEGLRIPPCKFLSGGEPSEEVRRLLRANLRLPEQVEGDILAQAAASRLAERRLRELLEEYRLADLSEL